MDECLAADAAGQLIEWVNTMPWVASSGEDTWGDYSTERQRLVDFFLANGAEPTVEMQEVIQLVDGNYLGRRFFCGNLQAVWSPATGVLTLINEDAETTEIDLSGPYTAANAA